MDILTLLNNPLSWVVIGVILLIAEVFSGDGSLLAFSVSGLLVALIIWLTGMQPGPLWLVVIFTFIGVFTAMFTRRLLKKTEKYKDDINTF